MKKSILSLVISSYLLFATVTLAFAKDSFKEIQKRREIVSNHITNLKKVATQINDENINHVLKFLENYQLAKPAPDKNGELMMEIIEPWRPGLQVIIIPMLQDDWKLGTTWENISARSIPIYFCATDDVPILIIRDIPMSDDWKALTLLHESTHALSFWQESFKTIPDPIIKRSLEEYDALKTEFILLNWITKNNLIYQDLLSKEITKITKKLEKNKLLRFPDFEEAEKLNSAFGTPASEVEKGLRLSTFWMHAVFQAMKNFNELPEETTVSFLFSAYNNGNIQ